MIPYADYRRPLETADDQEDIRENSVRVRREYRCLSPGELAQRCSGSVPALFQIDTATVRGPCTCFKPWPRRWASTWTS